MVNLLVYFFYHYVVLLPEKGLFKFQIIGSLKKKIISFSNFKFKNLQIFLMFSQFSKVNLHVLPKLNF